VWGAGINLVLLGLRQPAAAFNPAGLQQSKDRIAQEILKSENL
jgi:hypothetical protein